MATLNPILESINRTTSAVRQNTIPDGTRADLTITLSRLSALIAYELERRGAAQMRVHSEQHPRALR